MNNITFGNDKGGYYETVGGGAGNSFKIFIIFLQFLQFSHFKALVQLGMVEVVFTLI